VGVSISLLFVRGPSVQETLSELQLTMTADHPNRPPVQSAAIALVNLPSGFHMIRSNRCDEPRFTQAALAKLSQDGEVVRQALEEHVMFSRIEYWQNGAQQWSVSHAGDVDDRDLKSTGQPPELFDILRHEQLSQADDADFFDIAVRMADQLTGFRYDRRYDWMNESSVTLLASTVRVKRPSWKFW
jgi:hypothetical protein